MLLLLDVTSRSSHPTAAEPGKAWAHQPSPHHCDVLGVPVCVWSLFPGAAGVARGPSVFQPGMSWAVAGEPCRRISCVAQKMGGQQGENL